MTAVSAYASIDQLQPNPVTAGGLGFTLHILSNSGGFDETDAFTWNGIALTTTVISGFEVQAQVPASYIALPGTATVTNVGFNSVSLTINPPLVITTNSLPNGTQGSPYSFGLSFTGGTPPVQWSVFSGTLPAGLTLNVNTGVISGTPTASGSSDLRFQATDAGGGVDRKGNLTLLVQAVPTVLTITTTSPLTAAKVGIPYSQTFAAAAGTPPGSGG